MCFLWAFLLRWGEAIKAFVGCVERHAEIRELPVRLQGWTEGALVGRAKQSEAERSRAQLALQMAERSSGRDGRRVHPPVLVDIDSSFCFVGLIHVDQSDLEVLWTGQWSI